MKRLTVSLISLLMVASLGACNRTTKVEKQVEIAPNGAVSDTTTIDKEVTTDIKVDDVEVTTKTN